MSVATLSKQDMMLVHALHAAKVSLQAVRQRLYVEERDIRVIMLDISCDSFQPLPASLEVYLPGETIRIVSRQMITDIIAAIDMLGGSLVRR